MEIKIVGHPFEYDVTCMVLLFFPGESMQFVRRAGKSAWLSSRLVAHGEKLYAHADYYTPGGAFRCRKCVRDPSVEGRLRAIKYTVYQVFSRATGIFPPWGTLTGIKPTAVYRRLLAEKSAADLRACLTRDYCMHPQKIVLLHQICKVMETVKTDRKRDASLYVSIPFCPTRCSYCSFISVSAAGNDKWIDPYLTLLIGEIKEKCAVLRKHHLRLRAIYVGGGTPGILDTRQMARLLSAIRAELGEAPEEFNFELGRPDTVTREKLLLLKEAGVTRVCINTQTTNDQVLALAGRKHTAAQYFDAMRLTSALDFDSINTDLIAGLPGESEASFAQSLEDVLAAGADNVTVHTLAIKRSARLHEEKTNFDPRNDQVPRMLSAAYERLQTADFLPYYMYRQKNTVSNGENVGFARPDKIGKYNLYMMEDLHTVAACGAGASSKIISGTGGRVERVMNVKYPFEYIHEHERVQRNTALFDQKLEEVL